MQFVEVLRGRKKLPGSTKLPSPLSKDFDHETWGNAFGQFGDGSAEDTAAYAMGLVIAEQATKVMAYLNDVKAHTASISESDFRKRVVSEINRVYLKCIKATGAEIKDRKVMSAEELISLRPIQTVHGDRVDPRGALENMIDTARHQLREKGAFGRSTPLQPAYDPDHAIQIANILAAKRESMERLWSELVWSSPTVGHNGREYRVDDTASELALQSLIDLFRRDNLHERDHREAHRIGMRRRYGPTMSLVLSRDGGSIRVKRRSVLPFDLHEPIAALALNMEVSIEYHSSKFLDEAHHTIPGIDFGKLLEAWLALQICAQQDVMGLSGESVSRDQFCVRWDRAPLAAALAEVIDVSEKTATAILDFLTYEGGEERQTLWERPLVPIGGELAPIWQALLGAKPMRLIALWSKQDERLKNAYRDRGYENEDVICRVLKGISASRATPLDFTVIGPRIGLRGKQDDVDVMMIIGDVAFLLECRAMMHPATPYEFWSVSDELSKKIGQVLRKKEFLESNPAQFLRILKENGHPEITIRRTVALVVTNSYFNEGKRAEEPFFVHIDTLFNTLISGGVQFGDIRADGSERRFLVDFLGHYEHPGDAMAEAFKNPPKAEFYGRCARIDQFQSFPALDPTDVAGTHAAWVMDFSHIGEIETFLRSTSFAHMVTERA